MLAHGCAVTFTVHSCSKHLEEHNSERSASCGHQTTLWGYGVKSSPTGWGISRCVQWCDRNRTAPEDLQPVYPPCNAFTGYNAMAAKFGLHTAVILLVFLSPAAMETAQIPPSCRTAAACGEIKGLKCLIWMGVIFLLVPCYQMSLCRLKVLFLLQDSLGCSWWLLLPQPSCQHESVKNSWPAPVPREACRDFVIPEWVTHTSHRKPVDCRQCQQDFVAGRDFAAFLITEDATHQLDLTKASPRKQGDNDANIQSGREWTLYFWWWRPSKHDTVCV